MHSLPSPVPAQCLHTSSHISVLSLCPAAHSGPLLATQAHCEGTEIGSLSEGKEKILWNQAGQNFQKFWKLTSCFSWCPWLIEENFYITQGQKYTFKVESLGFEFSGSGQKICVSTEEWFDFFFLASPPLQQSLCQRNGQISFHLSRNQVETSVL